MHIRREIPLLLLAFLAISALYFLIFYILFTGTESCGYVETGSSWLHDLFVSCFG